MDDRPTLVRTLQKDLVMNQTAKADLISIIEACYQLHLSDEAWLNGVVTQIQPVFGSCAGALGFLLGGPAGQLEPPPMRAVIALGPLEKLSFFAPLLQRANHQCVIDRFVHSGPASTLRRTLGSFYSQRDGFESVLRPI